MNWIIDQTKGALTIIKLNMQRNNDEYTTQSILMRSSLDAFHPFRLISREGSGIFFTTQVAYHGFDVGKQITNLYSLKKKFLEK